MGKSKFEKNSGCYTCLDCGKLTRETGESESGCELCKNCFKRAGLENQHNDTSRHGKFEKTENCPVCERQ